MPEGERIKILDELWQRRKEAREQYRRLIHPEPLISELIRRKKIKVQLPALQRAGDFVEGVAKMLRSPDIWQSSVAGTIISKTISIVLPI